jgi:hypothetical protein
MTRFLTIEEVQNIHKELIDIFGGIISFPHADPVKELHF